MPVEVVRNDIIPTWERTTDNIDELMVEVLETGVAQAKALVPVSDIAGKDHLIDTIRSESTGSARDGRITGEVIAGDPGRDVDYPVYVEFGTGVHATGTGGTRAKSIPWVYYSPYYGFVTTSGNEPQPYMGPAYEVARQLAQNLARDVVDD